CKHPYGWPCAKSFWKFSPDLDLAILPVSFFSCDESCRSIFFFLPVFPPCFNGQDTIIHPCIFCSSGSIVLKFIVAPAMAAHFGCPFGAVRQAVVIKLVGPDEVPFFLLCKAADCGKQQEDDGQCSHSCVLIKDE